MNFTVLGIPGEWLTPVIQMVAAVVILTQFNTFVRYTRDVFPDSIFSRLEINSFHNIQMYALRKSDNLLR